MKSRPEKAGNRLEGKTGTTRSVVYGDVDYAIDIWDKIDAYKQVPGGKLVPVRNIINGSGEIPKVGDLFIYARVMFGGTGHVAVVTGVDTGTQKIKLGEQNYLNEKWPGSYAREVSYIKENGKYWVLDGYLVGWKRIISD